MLSERELVRRGAEPRRVPLSPVPFLSVPLAGGNSPAAEQGLHSRASVWIPPGAEERIARSPFSLKLAQLCEDERALATRK